MVSVWTAVGGLLVYSEIQRRATRLAAAYYIREESGKSAKIWPEALYVEFHKNYHLKANSS